MRISDWSSDVCSSDLGGQGDDLRLLHGRQRQLAAPLDMGVRGALEPHRGRLLTKADTEGWLKALIGHAPKDRTAFHQALTHGSAHAVNYERLEFLGDRIQIGRAHV